MTKQQIQEKIKPEAIVRHFHIYFGHLVDQQGKRVNPTEIVDWFMDNVAIHLGAGEADRLREQREWISVKDRLPELDPADKWCLGSKRVLTSSDMGIRFGQYFQNGDFWRVEGVTSSEGIPVTHWMLIEPPKPQTDQP